MLNIGKLGVGGADYYLETVASGIEDYYTGAGESPGYWLGRGSGELGLSGRVDDAAFRAVLGAADPRDGTPLIVTAAPRRVPGFDLTFRAPKSVSLLYGLSGSPVAGQVWEAHDAAVAAAVGYLEEAAGYTRRGLNGRERVPVAGFVAAAFRHRTSRAGDPLLHTHVVVSNLGRAVDDGCWRTLDGRGLYVHAKTAGYLYQAHLRHELTRRLGVEWGEVRNGCADLVGVPAEVIQAFSQRRAEIVAHMAARGETSARAAQVATLATRRAKQRHVDGHVLGAEWAVRAAALGFGLDQVQALVGRVAGRDLGREEAEGIVGWLVGPEGLTHYASSFGRREVLRAWCEAMPAGASVAQVQVLADRVLRENEVVLLAPDGGRLGVDGLIRRQDGRVVVLPDEARYSTVDLLAAERRALSLASDGQDAGRAIAAPDRVERALAERPTLSGEQAEMVRRLTSSGAAVDVVVGKAGSGKTYALGAAREAWQRSGVRVIGCALAARAAQELNDGARIPSTSIDALLTRFDRTGGGLPVGSVLVVDEAGMVGTRKLAQLFEHADRARAKVVLVGDYYQLPEIEAGGLFRALAERLPVVELTENRRQVEGWERDALDELRCGDVAKALDAYARHGRIVVGEDPEALREQLVDAWWQHRVERPDERGVMIAARLADVDDLNRRARVRLAAGGKLHGPALPTPQGREFQAGDHVMALRNDRSLDILNGTQGVVLQADPETRTLTVEVNGGERHVQLPASYLDAGHLAHAYAITGHKAQGLTVDRAWVLTSARASREWHYVALSRAKRCAHLHVGQHPRSYIFEPPGV